MSVEEMHTQQTNNVNSAYLVDNPDKALDFLLHDTQRLRRRIQSQLPSLLSNSDDEIHRMLEDKLQKMRLM